MGELAEDWDAFNEYKKARRDKIEPSRVEYAMNKLIGIGCQVSWNGAEKALSFVYLNIQGKIYPYTGWWSAKGLGSGRGIKTLINKLGVFSL